MTVRVQRDRNAPRQTKQDFRAWLINLLTAPIGAGKFSMFGGMRDLVFRGGDCSPQNISSPMPTRRYMARLRWAAQHPGRKPA